MHGRVPVCALVGASSVVPGLDVAKDGSFSLTVGSKTLVVVELSLEMREPVLGHGVIPADPGAAHWRRAPAGLSDLAMFCCPTTHLHVQGVATTS